MNVTSACGCGSTSCCAASCCDGNDARVPEAIDNGPGQSALHYRVGTYASFFESMLAWLVTPPEPASACEGVLPSEDPDPLGIDVPLSPGGEQSDEDEQARIDWPLRKLTTRDLDDPSIALLDAWAMVGDILTFYQERIVNEGFLRTATEQRSVEELARLVGYRPRPGVAASVDLAFTLDPGVITEIPTGTRGQSLPGPGQLPQAFETSGPLPARASWNLLRPLQTKFRTPEVVGGQLQLFLAGIATNLRINDVMLVIPPLENPTADLNDLEEKNDTASTRFWLAQLVNATKDLYGDDEDKHASAKVVSEYALGQLLLLHDDPDVQEHGQELIDEARDLADSDMQATLDDLDEQAKAADATEPSFDQLMDSFTVEFGQMKFRRRAKRLFRVDRVEVLAALSTTRVLLRRYTNESIQQADEGDPRDEFTQKFDIHVDDIVESFGGDGGDRLRTDREILELVSGDRALRESFRTAIEDLDDKRQSGTKVFVFRSSSPLFGHNATDGRFIGVEAQPIPWPLPKAPNDERNDRVFLDTVNDRVQPGGFIVIDPATPISAPTKPGPDVDPPDKETLETAIEAIEAADISLEFSDDFDVAKYLINLNDTSDPVEAFWLNTLVDATKDLKSSKKDRAKAVCLLAAGRLLERFEGDGEEAEAVRGHGAGLVLQAQSSVQGADREHLDDLDDQAEALEPDDKKAINEALTPQPSDSPAKALAVYDIETVSTHSRDAYGIAKQTLDLTLVQDWITWPVTVDAFLEPLRSVVTYNESEQLAIARTPLERLEGDVIDLEGLIFDLEPGRLLIVEGEDFDTPGSRRTERAYIASVVHDLIDVSTHVELVDALEHRYVRSATYVYGNVAPATQGETRNEVLGSGDASKPSQQFTLRHQPLTHVPAATPDGAASTLTVRVNGFAWPEADVRPLLGPRDRKIVTQTDDKGRTTVIGGDGWHGARFPTGVENITAQYRSGQGADGNVEPNKITNLATRPFGVQKVTNPIAASGGAGPDGIEATRLRVPLAVKALDRLVSVADYQDFALRFAGIAKAKARLVNGDGVHARWKVRTIIAGIEPLALDPKAELITRLRQAMRRFGDPSLDLEVVPAKLEMLAIRARVAIAPGWVFDEVAPRLRATLLDQLSYERQDIGQAIHPSRIVALAQGVAGVEFLDLDELQALGITDDEPLIFELGEAILPDADTILRVDPTRPETLDLEEWTP